ncbi:MAG: multicopper oxidase family protein [Candidatus Eremiobacteraeota bacterium]|nr:multicopper oxidase family protein [Candidatus Eremiobacteraeota bacterium]
MRRKVFIAASATAMASFALPRLPEASAARATVEATLIATPLRFHPAPGQTFNALSYNGMLPGPLIRVVRGQRLKTTFINRSGAPSTVHWHGFLLPNAMDGAAGITQPSVENGGTFTYDFEAKNPGTRWYHDHDANLGLQRGLYGMAIVEDPSDERADMEFALVFHDIPRLESIDPAMRGVSKAPMVDPAGSPELREMTPDDMMGDEVAYSAHCINGRTYPQTTPLAVKVGQRVRLRILNANATQTRYVRLGEHRLTVTHADGNRLIKPMTVDALRIGVAERYDAWFEVKKPGAWLLQGISADPNAYQQAVVVHTEGMERATPLASSSSLEGVDYFTYERAGGPAHRAPLRDATTFRDFVLGGGEYGSNKWTIDGKTYPEVDKISVRHGDSVMIRFTNKTDMDHPMHLHGHTFDIVAVDDRALARPLAKDVSLVRANGGTLTWRFAATSPPGRWLLHCHNDIHMMDGMMTEVVYDRATT